MNILNRVIVVLGIVVLILFAVMLIVLAWAYSGESIHRLSLFVQYLTDHDTTLPKVIITLGSAFVILIAFAALLIEIVPRADKTVLVRDVGAGTAVLSTAAVARRLEQLVGTLPEVEAVRASVSRRKDAVEVNLQVMVHPESDLAMVATEVSQTTQEGVTEQMSVALARPPKLRLYYSSRPTASREHPSTAEEPQQARPRRAGAAAHREAGKPPAEPASEASQAEPPPPSDESAPHDEKP